MDITIVLRCQDMESSRVITKLELLSEGLSSGSTVTGRVTGWTETSSSPGR
jgi:hypothetical protein